MKQYYYLTKRNNSKNWYYRFKHEKTYHSTGYSKKADAVKYIENIINGALNERDIPILADFTKDFFIWDKCKWIERQHRKNKRFSNSHAKDRRAFLINHILPKFGKRLMTSIQPHEIDDWLLTIDRSNQTLNQILYTLRIIYSEAERLGLLQKNPAEKVKQFTVNHEHRDILTDEEIDKLFPLDLHIFNEIWEDHTVGVMCYLLIATGMRQGEARALKWEDIDWDNDIVYINHSMKRDNTRGCTKNGKCRVSVLSIRIKSLLQRLRNNSKYNTDQDYIFTLNGKKPFWTNHLYKYFTRALKAVEIQDERNIVVHSLRHTFVTRCRKNRLPEVIIQKIVGHSDSAVTDIYDHTEDIDFLRFNKTNIEKMKALCSDSRSRPCITDHKDNTIENAV